MKLNITQKPKKKFNPIKHWYTMLITFSVIILIIAVYGIYSFFYIKNQISLIDIEAKYSILNSTSADILEKSKNDNKFLKDVNNLNVILEEYKKREVEYQRLIKSATPAISLPVIASSTASTTVATSTQ